MDDGKMEFLLKSIPPLKTNDGMAE